MARRKLQLPDQPCSWRAAGFFNRICVAVLLLGCSGAIKAEELIIPGAAQVQSAIENYVDNAKQAPGVVVGVLRGGQRQIYSYGDAGRKGLELGGDTLFEIGSISKVFTGLLLSEMVLRGEVRYDQTIAELAPDQFSFAENVGAITLEQLAMHTSGLPRVATDFGPAIRGLFSSDPYAGSTAAEIFTSIALLSDEQLGTQGEFAYSNLGYALLGQLLAEAAGLDFESLLRSRILEPSGVDSIAFGPAQADPALLAQGFNRGRPASHWHLDAYTPAGGLIASTNQMLDFIEANLEAKPNFMSEAQRFRRESAGERPRTLGIGYAHREIGDQAWLWHNGGTGGFRSYFGFAPARDFGIVVLTNGTGNVDALAASLIRADASPVEAYERSWFGILMALLGVLIAPLALLAGAFGRARQPKPGRRAPDRLDMVALIAVAGMLLVVSRIGGDWISVPFALWWLGMLVSLAAAGALFRAQFAERAWRSGSVLSLLGRLLMLTLYVLIIIALI